MPPDRSATRASARSRADPSRLPAPLLAAGAIGVAVALDVVIASAALALGLRGPGLQPLQVAFLVTLLCAAGATVFLAVRGLHPRLAPRLPARLRDPALAWRALAYAALAVSFIPDLALVVPAFRGIYRFPDVSMFTGGSPSPRGNFAGGAPPPGGFGGAGFGANLLPMVGVLVLMHLVAGVVLTEALARWGLHRSAAPEATPEGTDAPAEPTA